MSIFGPTALRFTWLPNPLDSGLVYLYDGGGWCGRFQLYVRFLEIFNIDKTWPPSSWTTRLCHECQVSILTLIRGRALLYYNVAIPTLCRPASVFTQYSASLAHSFLKPNTISIRGFFIPRYDDNKRALLRINQKNTVQELKEQYYNER